MFGSRGTPRSVGMAAWLVLAMGCSETVSKTKTVAPTPTPTTTAAAPSPAKADPLARAIELERQAWPPSVREARAIYESWCRKGNARACYHYDEVTFTTGIKSGPTPPHAEELDLLCKADDYAACYELALTLDDSGGMPKDAARAFALFNRACDGGYTFACEGVAEYYLVSFPSQEADAAEKALRYAWRACQAGRGGSCSLARLAQPEPRPEDIPSRDEIIELGCKRGSVFSCTLLADEAVPKKPFACDQCDPDVKGWVACIECDEAAAYDKHCCATCPNRDTHAACSFSPGEIKRHPRKSQPLPAKTVTAANAKLHTILDPVVSWLEPSCKLGHVPACYDLAAILLHEEWPLHDAKRSATLLAEACEKGSGNACSKLAELDGQDAEALRKKAQEHFERKCALGVGNACWATVDPG